MSEVKTGRYSVGEEIYACQVGMRNGQVQSKYETSINSHSVKKWERNPYPSSDFVLKV